MFTVQVFGGDAGGQDLDFEADTLDEAKEIARDEHRPGSRPTDVYDEDGRLVYSHDV